ncbi:MAG: hypothetical protein M0P74_09140 [Syntrophales bacterium]|jgi:hypothetical protein|nr:hypothetical protein [Syntrophales bacterium]
MYGKCKLKNHYSFLFFKAVYKRAGIAVAGIMNTFSDRRSKCCHTENYWSKPKQMRQLQNHLSFPNVSIGNMVFQAVRTRFPLRIVAGMTRMGSFAITSNEQRKTGRRMIVCQRTGFVAEKSDKSMKILYETTSFPPAQSNLYPI